MATAQRTLPGMRGFLGHRHGEPVTLADGRALAVVIPGIVLKSPNLGVMRQASMGARFAQAAKARKQREDVTLILRSRFGPVPPALPLTITVTRVAPGKLDGHDALPLSAKHVVDAIAAWLGVDDADSRLTWRYAQARDGRSYAVGIRIEATA
jgi:hypothetical protein